MNAVAQLLNSAWMLAGRRESTRYHFACRHVRATQEQVLRDIVRSNRRCEFGQRNGFDRVESAADFQQLVPVSEYENYVPAISRIGQGASRVLTDEPVVGLHPTGGSSGGEKLVPYTRSLHAQFQRAIAAWIADLFQRFPRARQGRAYWSISPALGPPRFTPAGIPIGFNDDSEYLSPLTRWAAKYLMVAPNTLARITDLNWFRYRTLGHLLEAEDLSLISVWSPTFILGLFDDLSRWRESLAQDIAKGRWRCPEIPRESAPTALTDRVVCSRSRRQHVARVLRSSTMSTADWVAQLWPHLALISTWTDGASAGPAETLRHVLPQTPIQSKGLLATEAFVSFSWGDGPGMPLALRSHFFEFLPLGSGQSATPLLADELQAGVHYEVIITTGGGLYRYRLGDVVQVVGHEAECPRIRFVARSSAVSDMVGEKLSAIHVQRVLSEVWASIGVQPRFVLLTSCHTPQRGYRLYLQDEQLTPPMIDQIAEQVESKLRENPQYRYAVGLQQLSPVEVCLIGCGEIRAGELYDDTRLRRGQRWGDIKPQTLDTATDWAPLFEPWVVMRSTAVGKHI